MIALMLLTLQAPPPAQVAKLTAVHARLERLGRTAGDSIWPGFRPDTIPVLYVLPGQGTLLLGWRGAQPEGFTNNWQPSSALGAASTGTEIAGRRAAQVVVADQSEAELVGISAHEAFHVFQAAVRTPGKRFGQGENAFYVSRYPVFDAANEAGMALEGRILAAAERATTRAAKQELARQFVAARESRHRALGPELAAFEQLAELNEGLAEYALLRANPTARGERLEQLTANTTQSIRLRFYVTGPAQARLLDALAGASWKTRLVAENLTLQDALAEASGYRAGEQQLTRQSAATFHLNQLRAAADTSVLRLRALRRAQVDSILAAPGILLVVKSEGRTIGMCGIDPQNLLQVDQNVTLHTRWLHPCMGDALDAEFNTPVVQDNTGLRAVVGSEATLRAVVAGQPLALTDGLRLEHATDLQLESPTVTLRAARAEVSRTGRVVTVTVRTP